MLVIPLKLSKHRLVKSFPFNIFGQSGSKMALSREVLRMTNKMAKVVNSILNFPNRIPVGEETLGRIINVIGDPIDERGPINTDKVSRVKPEAPLSIFFNQ